MTSLFDKGSAIEAKACELIMDAPKGTMVIGGPYANLGPHFGRFDDIPTRDSITPVIDDVITAMGPLSYTGTDQVGQTGTAIVPNGAFPNIELVGPDLDNWDGRAAVAFFENYQTRMPVVPQAQFVAASVLVHALEAEIDLWERVKRDAHDIADKTLAALEEAGEKDGASFAFGLTVLAALATVAVTVATGGAAGAIVLTVAAGAASSGASAVSIPHDAPDAAGVMTAMYDGLNTLESEIRTKEQEIADGLTDMARLVEGDLARTGLGDSEFPTFTFKPTPLASGPGGLGRFDPDE